jgi:paraquat-inducible protein A
MTGLARARDQGLAACARCAMVLRLVVDEDCRCPRCGARVHSRKSGGLALPWALLSSALLMYIPAHTEPIMYSRLLGKQSADTIISGILYFLRMGDWLLATIIFIASLLVPLLKMAALAYLLISVQRRQPGDRLARLRLYRLADWIGRWSMVDVFVVALLAALVQAGQVAFIAPGPGVFAFAAVVVLTGLATKAFDPRLLWD